MGRQIANEQFQGTRLVPISRRPRHNSCDLGPWCCRAASNSSDLSPIEMVWSIVPARVRREQPACPEALKPVFEQIWIGLDKGGYEQVRDRLHESPEHACRSLSAQYLSSRSGQPFPSGGRRDAHSLPFLNDEDKLRVRCGDRLGNKRTGIS